MSQSLLAANTGPVTIAFNEIPANILVPGVYTEVAPNYSAAGLVGYTAAVLLMVPVLATGTLAPLTPTQVFTPAQGTALVGAGGIGDGMIRAFLAANPWTTLYVMALATPGGATTASWAVQALAAGTLATSGVAALYINGKQYAYSVVGGVDTGATTDAGLAALITADTACPVVVTSTTGGVITLTARDAGAIGNQIDVRWNLLPGDQNVAGLTQTVTPTAGTGVHAVATAFAAVPTLPVTDIVCPWNDAASSAALSAELERRFGAMLELDAVGYGGFIETTVTTLLSDTAGLNERFASYLQFQKLPTAVYLLAAIYGAVASYYLMLDPARQLKGLALPGVVAPAQVDVLTETERQQLLAGGGATCTVDRDGTVRIERAVTTYKDAPGNVPDSSWRDIMTAKVMQRIRYDWRNFVKLQYPRNKMAADGTLAAEYDDSIVTPRRMHGSWASRCRLYEQLGWIQNSAQTVAQSVFQLDATDPNRMDARMQVQIMNNLMVLAGRIEFSQQAATAGAQG